MLKIRSKELKSWWSSCWTINSFLSDLITQLLFLLHENADRIFALADGVYKPLNLLLQNFDLKFHVIILLDLLTEQLHLDCRFGLVELEDSGLDVQVHLFKLELLLFGVLQLRPVLTYRRVELLDLEVSGPDEVFVDLQISFTQKIVGLQIIDLYFRISVTRLIGS